MTGEMIYTSGGGGVELMDAGKYVLTPGNEVATMSSGVISNIGSAYTASILVNIDGLGYSSVTVASGGYTYAYVPVCYLKDGTVDSASGTQGTGTKTFTLASDTKYVQFGFGTSNNSGVNSSITFS